MRRTHRSTDDLPLEAQRLMTAGFRARKTYAAIARDLAEIDIEVPERTVARRGQEWAFAQRRRQENSEWIEDLIAASKKDPDASEFIQALARDALKTDPESWAEADPIKVQAQALYAEEIRLKREKLELERSRHELDKAKFARMQVREERAIAAAEELRDKAGRGEALTVEDLNKIREIYGLAPAAEARN